MGPRQGRLAGLPRVPDAALLYVAKGTLWSIIGESLSPAALDQARWVRTASVWCTPSNQEGVVERDPEANVDHEG